MEEIKIGSNLTAAAGEAGRRKKVFQIGRHSLTGAQVKSKARPTVGHYDVSMFSRVGRT